MADVDVFFFWGGVFTGLYHIYTHRLCSSLLLFSEMTVSLCRRELIQSMSFVQSR